ncbi:MAG: hypothetical protein E7052_03115 [Lentisphaerae bacterium]|nr:hypothetical protein [Lentisphaerota bacterium]
MKSIFSIVVLLLAMLQLPAADLSSVLTPEVLQKAEFELPSGVYTTGNFTIPAGFTLKFAPGARIEVASGAVLTINGAITAALQPVITGAGKVNGAPQMEYIYPDWFGAVGDDKTDCTKALQTAAALAAQCRGKLLKIASGRYRYNGDIIIKSNVECQGVLVNAMKLNPKAHDRFRVFYPMYYPVKSARIRIQPDEPAMVLKNGNFFGIKRNTFRLPRYKALALQKDPAVKIDLAQGGTLRLVSSDFFTTRANNRNDEYYNKEDIVVITSNQGDVFPEFNFDFDNFLGADEWSANKSYKKGDYVKVGKDFYKATLASGKGVMYKHKRYGECEVGPRSPEQGVKQNVTYTNGKKDKLNFWCKLSYSVEYIPPQKPLHIKNLQVEAFIDDDDPNARVVHTQLVLCNRSNVTFERMQLKSIDQRMQIYNLLSLTNVVNTTLNDCYFSGALQHGMGYNIMQHNVANSVLNNCISTNARKGLAGRHGKNITVNGGHYNCIDDHYGKNYVIRDVVFDAWSTWVLGYRTPQCDANKLVRTPSTAVVLAGENIIMENCKVYNPRFILCNRADVGDFGGQIILRNIAVFNDKPKKVIAVNHTVDPDFDYTHKVITPQRVLLDNVTVSEGSSLELNVAGADKSAYIVRDSVIGGLDR